MTDAHDWQSALDMLSPLEAQIDAALAVGNVESAMAIAFGGASRAVALVAGPSSAEETAHGTAKVHGVVVELTPLPLDTYEDGTLSENGAYVSLTYQSWAMTPAQAERMAGEWAGAAGWTVDSS